MFEMCRCSKHERKKQMRFINWVFIRAHCNKIYSWKIETNWINFVSISNSQERVSDLSALLCECAKSIKVPVGQNIFETVQWEKKEISTFWTISHFEYNKHQKCDGTSILAQQYSFQSSICVCVFIEQIIDCCIRKLVNLIQMDGECSRRSIWKRMKWNSEFIHWRFWTESLRNR